MLTTYLNRTNRLLQYPTASPQTLYSTADLTDYINQARGQVAGEGQCIMALGTIPTVVGQTGYNFSDINTGTPAITGIQGVLNISRIALVIAGTGRKILTPRPWDYFDQYYINNPVPASGPPTVWAQYGQGSAGIGSITGVGAGTMVGGNFFINPIPDQVYVLSIRAACYPNALVVDTDVEAIPYLWTDAVPYFAAYLALLSAQSGQRQADAARMLERYGVFVERARAAANPDRLKYIYQGAPDPAQLNKFGLQGGQQ